MSASNCIQVLARCQTLYWRRARPRKCFVISRKQAASPLFNFHSFSFFSLPELFLATNLNFFASNKVSKWYKQRKNDLFFLYSLEIHDRYVIKSICYEKVCTMHFSINVLYGQLKLCLKWSFDLWNITHITFKCFIFFSKYDWGNECTQNNRQFKIRNIDIFLLTMFINDI